MKIALLQYDILKNKKSNWLKVENYLLNLQGQGIDLAILPEFCLTGYSKNPEKIAFKMQDKDILKFNNLSIRIGTDIIGGFCIYENKKYHNRSLFFSGLNTKSYDKKYLFSFWDENKMFIAGKSASKIKCKGTDLSLFICYDLRFPEFFRSVRHSQVMVVIANWPEKRSEHWPALLKARAIENQAYVVGVNRIGAAGQTKFAGASSVYDPYGKKILDMGDKEGIAFADLDFSLQSDYRKHFPVLDDFL